MKKTDAIKLVPVSEASEALCISENTLRQWLCRRKFPFVKVGRRTVISIDDLKKFVDENRVEVH